MKKFLSLAICLLIIFSCGTTASAVEVDTGYSTATPDSSWDLLHNWKESKTYEFVSYTPPTKDTYIFEDCGYPASVVSPNCIDSLIDVDDTGMTVTVRNKVTGQLEVYGHESVEDRLLLIGNVLVRLKKSGDYALFTTLFMDNGEVMGFPYEVNVVFRNTDWDTQPPTDVDNGSEVENTTQRPDPQISTADSATSDEVIMPPTTVGNKPVGTGDFFPACMVFVAMSALTIAAILAYRKKKEQ